MQLGEVPIKTHISDVFAKLDLRERVHAGITAYRPGREPA